MLHFVIEQVEFYGQKLERNVRVGGYKNVTQANKAAVAHAPAFVKDATGAIVGQTYNRDYPRFISHV